MFACWVRSGCVCWLGEVWLYFLVRCVVAVFADLVRSGCVCLLGRSGCVSRLGEKWLFPG